MKNTSPQTARKIVDSRRSWLILIIVFFSLFIVGGLQLSFGTILSKLVQQYGESKSKTAWVGSLMTLFSSVLSPLSVTFSQRCGIRVTHTIGGLLFAIGLITTSLVESIDYMFLTYGTLLGFSGALLYTPSFAIIPTLFDKHVTVAMGITASANTFGLVFFSSFLPSLLAQVDWQKTLWVISALGPLICLFGLVLPATFVEPGAVEVRMEECEPSPVVTKQPWWKSIKKKAFVLWAFVTMIYGMAEFVPLYLVPLCANEQGMSASQTKWLNIIFGLACIPGKLASGPISQKLLRRDQCKYIYLIMLFFHSVSSYCVSLNPSFTWLVVYMVMYGLVEGVSAGLFFVVTLEIVGMDGFAHACALVMASAGLACTAGTPIAGLFYEHFPNINLLFIGVSATTLLASILMAIIPCVIPRRVCDLRPGTNEFWRICAQSPNIPRKILHQCKAFTIENFTADISRKQHPTLTTKTSKSVSQTHLVDTEAQLAA